MSTAEAAKRLGDPTDAGIIAAIVAMSVGLGFFNEYRAAKSVAALHGDIHYRALAWRDGAQREVDVSELVPGDVVGLRVGAVVPADLRLLQADALECDEAVLTGESSAAVKSIAACPPSDSDVDLSPCAFMGTIVHQGSGRGVVVSTGARTAFGKIAAGLGERQAETAFQAGLRGFSKLLVKVAGVLTVSIFVINVAFQRPLIDALLFSLAIAIGITPQLLPAIVSISLSSGSRALAKKRVLVELKDIQLPESMQRAMAPQAEAEREKRAKIIAAEGETLAAGELANASDTMMEHPLALQLRNLQTLVELGVDKNSTVVFPAPLMSTIQELGAFLNRETQAVAELPKPPAAAPVPTPVAPVVEAATNGKAAR